MKKRYKNLFLVASGALITSCSARANYLWLASETYNSYKRAEYIRKAEEIDREIRRASLKPLYFPPGLGSFTISPNTDYQKDLYKDP